MTPVQVLVLVVALERLAELLYARRNEQRLRAEGGIEVGAGHYPLLVIFHAALLLALVLLVPADAPVIWPVVAIFLVLQATRVWVIASLGRFWTTRVITVPGTPLVRRGPYRWLRHPNYVVVTLEVACLPLAFGAWEIALVAGVINALLLAHRIRVENAALSDRRTIA